MSATVRSLTSQQILLELPELADFLVRCVDAGDVGGLPTTMTGIAAEEHWMSLREDLRKGGRVLLVAYLAGRIAGYGQVRLSASPCARHRAVAERVYVDIQHRGLGIGRRIMVALHDAALNRGRWLMLLSVRECDSAQRFCRALGYLEAGKVPAFELNDNGQTFDHTAFFRQLGPARELGAVNVRQHSRRS